MTPRPAVALLLAFAIALPFVPSAARAQDTLRVYATGILAGCADIEFDSAGNLYATGGAGGGGKIYKVPPGGGAASVLTSSGLYYPWGLAMSPGGTLYVVDTEQGTTPSSGRILTVSPTGTLTLFKDNLPGPVDITFDPSGNLYVALPSQNKVAKITPGGVMTDYATGLGVVGESVFPISFDEAGNLYAGVLQDIYKIGPGGSPVTKLISGGLHEVIGLVRWGYDSFFIGNYGYRQLVYVTPSTAPLNLLSSRGCAIGKLFNGITPATASMTEPTGMRLRAGTVYVGDNACHEVRAFDLSGNTPTPAGRYTWGQLKSIYR